MIIRLDARVVLRNVRGFSRFMVIAVIAAVPAVQVGATEIESVSRDDNKVDFARDIYPVLKQACLECHGDKKQEGSLRLDLREEALESGSIEPGYPSDSELFRRITLPRGHDEVMPAVGQPLSRRQIETMRDWIQQGAKWPKDFEADRHWSYVGPQRPDVPKTQDSTWPQSPIDQFVLRRLNIEGLRPSSKARPEKLVRRLYLDLIGLPPTPAEIDAYLADHSPDRFETLVDDLISRSQYGERWARPWLDLARYADSHGFQKDNLREHWAYRDWVIRALNDDMPFDQFTIEQIAGDLLPGASESQKIATGFHRCTPSNVEAGSLPEETRVEQVIDRVNTTGAVWLGTTLECCQCHDHKYDPFSQRDYYRILAFYNNTQMEADRANPKTPSSIQFNGPSLPLTNPQRDAQRRVLKKRLANLKQQQNVIRDDLDSHLESWATELVQIADSSPKTHLLTVADFDSQGVTDTYETLDDGSILLVGGDPPDTDLYTARVRLDLADISAFRLDVLRHESLPGEGPGRGDPVRRNFVLNEFSVEIQPTGAEGAGELNQTVDRVLEFKSAKASFSQKNWDVAEALQKGAKSGWAIAPQFDRSHWATFQLADRLNATKDVELVFRLKQEWGNARTIGCFQLSAITGQGDQESVPVNVLKIATKSPKKWSKRDRNQLLNYRVKGDARSVQLEGKIGGVKKELDALAPDTTLVMIELDQPRMTSVFERGDYMTPGDSVQPGAPSILHLLPDGPSNRLTLADWLVSPDNPLVARVTVNRWWAELFGQGIVRTVEDFGVKGDLPSHPDLLDWLAFEFVEKGWSQKRLLKTIVMSATYQQSSQMTDELIKKDDQNRLLARGPLLRMDAEMIRDNALAIAGLIDLKQFGQSIRPFQPDGIWTKTGGTAYDYQVSPGGEQYRRGVYVILKRGSPYPSFSNFDATARLACTVKRSRTNTPLQALTLLNDPVYVAASKALAKRVVTEKADKSFGAQLDFAFQLCTGRTPTSEEQSVLRELYHQQQVAQDNQAEHSSGSQAELDAWTSVATVLLNLHETIMKD